MPIHDWTRVTAGTFHDFHTGWITSIRQTLNDRLPAKYYAQAEQIAGPLGVDVLTLERSDDAHGSPVRDAEEGGVALAVAAPRVRLVDEGEMHEYALKRQTVVIRHTSGHRIVALVEIVSPGNKGGQYAFDTFVEKAVEALHRGYHLLVLDLFPPTARDPEGIHSAIWHEFNDTAFALPPGLPLTLAAYSAGPRKRAYVEPTAVGRGLIEMPLFLTEERYINVPLEESYQAAYRGIARFWKDVLEANPPADPA